MNFLLYTIHTIANYFPVLLISGDGAEGGRRGGGDQSEGRSCQVLTHQGVLHRLLCLLAFKAATKFFPPNSPELNKVMVFTRKPTCVDFLLSFFFFFFFFFFLGGALFGIYIYRSTNKRLELTVIDRRYTFNRGHRFKDLNQLRPLSPSTLVKTISRYMNSSRVASSKEYPCLRIFLPTRDKI